MTKKLLLCLLFFSVSPALLGFILYFNVFSSSTAERKVLGEATSLPPPTSASQVYGSFEEQKAAVAPTIEAAVATPIIIENYLRYYHSPLLPYTNKILEEAEKNGLKPQLLVAIAQQESNLGKKSPEGCYNAWGWAIHERGTLCFSNWEEAIEVVARGIAVGYCQKGLCDDPCEMMKKYTPKSNGSWCAGVNQFLKEMETGFR